ncbi:MAG: hypothetical protein ABIT71_20210, partial [Vicinamibacteraceae bacterium]
SPPARHNGFMSPWRRAAIVPAVILAAAVGVTGASRPDQTAHQAAGQPTRQAARQTPPAVAAPASPPAPQAPASADAPPFHTPLPLSHPFIRKMRAAIRFDEDLQQAYTYLERRRDVKVTGLGRITVGPLRTFEVYPSNQPGRTYKRLIAVDGTPLPPADLARRDDEHRRNLLAEVEREKAEAPAVRNARLAKEAQERRERDAIANDAFAIFEATAIGRDVVDGQPALILWVAPRKNASPRTREGGYMKKFAGKLWIAEADGAIVRLDLTAFDDISVGYGVVGRVHQGARLEFARRRVNNETWLPSSSHITAKGRTLLFRPFTFDVRTDYTDYKKWSVETKVTYDGPTKP